jgi:hypothetical protein
LFEEILAKLALALDKHSIPYIIIGGQAVLLYGEPRLTRDIDVTLGVDVDSLPEITKMAKGLNLKPLPSKVEDFVKKTMVLPTKDETTGIRVDFIKNPSSLNFSYIRKWLGEFDKSLSEKDLFKKFEETRKSVLE